MALAHSPSIVTNGLILFVDAANPRSYPGSGTTSTDLSGNGKNGTLTNMDGTNYSTDKKGFFNFNGIDETIRFGTGADFFPLNEFTMEIWFRPNGTTAVTGTLPTLIGFTYGIWLQIFSTYLQFGLDNGTSFITQNSPAIYSFYDNPIWYNAVIQANSTTRYLYINGELSSTKSDTWLGQTRWPTNAANIGRDNNGSFLYFTGAISLFKIYNRVLTANEVQQNYDALKGRYT